MISDPETLHRRPAEMNDEITRISNEHKRESGDVGSQDRSYKAENEAIRFDGSQVTSPKQIANYFNRQFTTSKLGRHISSRDTRLVYREIKRNYLTSAVTFTTDQVYIERSSGII